MFFVIFLKKIVNRNKFVSAPFSFRVKLIILMEDLNKFGRVKSSFLTKDKLEWVESKTFLRKDCIFKFKKRW